MSDRIHSIHHETGEILPVSTLPTIVANPAWGSYLNNLGIRNFSRLNPNQLMDKLRVSIGSTLEKAGITGSEVDAFILFSTTFDPYVAHSDLAKLSVEFGLSSAVPYGMFHNQCTNYSQTLEFAQYLLRSKNMKRVLLVGCDVLDENRGDRVMENRVSVYSDVVVSCIVENNAVPGWEIQTVQHSYLPALATYTSAQDIVKFIQDYSRGVQEVVGKAYEATTSTPEQFDLLVTANYNQSVVKNLAELAGIPVSKMDLSALENYAHCFSADQLISLQKRHDKRLVNEDEYSLLLAVGGFVTFSATVLRWKSA